MALVTAHWDSAAQHAECIGSAENRGAMRAMAPHALAGEIRFFHVEGAWAFGLETLEMALLSVVRIGVEGGEGQRARVEGKWKRAKGLVEGCAGAGHAAGWRVEKEVGREEREEFVVVGAWRDGDALRRFVDGIGKGIGMGWEWENAAAWDKIWGDVMLEMDVKTYSRIA